MNDLATNGYQIVHDVMSEGEVHSMRLAINETIDRVAKALRAPFSTSDPEARIEERLDSIAHHDRVYALALFRAVLADSHRDPRIEMLAHHPRLTSIVSDLLSPLSRTGQVIRARAAVQAFSSAGHRWHQDVVRPAPDGCGSVRFACWIPLSDVDQYTGSLEVVRSAAHDCLPHESDSDSRFFIPEEHLPMQGREVVALKCGDVLIVDRFTPHRSLPIPSGRSRWAVAMWVKAA